MAKTDTTATLQELLDNHHQLCLGVKALADGGCSRDTLLGALEDACDSAEKIMSVAF